MIEEKKKKIIENLIPLFEEAGRICLELRRQGLKKGGTAKGCGAVMSNRRKTTKVF